jgi:PAS domain S-box-containing protein
MDNKKTKDTQLSNQLNNTRAQINNIIESLDVGTWEWNIKTGEIIFSNRWSQMTGYSLEDFEPINKKKIETITHPDDFETSNKLMSQHLSGELPYYKYENRIKHKNGNWVWICERGSVIERDESDKPLIMFGTHTDITKKKQMEQALENYINVLNHDLRSPLSTIIGYSSFLIEDDLTKEEIKKYSTIINKTGGKMLKMIESYLSLAKIERGQDILGKKSKKIVEIVDEINKNFSDLINKNKLKIILGNLENETTNNDLLQETILIDEILIYSVINNLLHNAADASPKKEDEIAINVYTNNNELYFSFYNKGEIQKEFQKKLFKKFISTKKNGTGIGLYSARLIARAHGGDVNYQSLPGGTLFILKIPLNNK